MDETGFFAQVPQQQFEWHGRAMRLPVFYRDARMAQVRVSMHAGEVERLLPSLRLHPLRIAPGRCLMVVALMQYRDTDIGPYEEVLVGFPCTLDRASPQFAGSLRDLPDTLMVVHWLGVSTPIALQAGDELLFTRKFMAEFSFDEPKDGWVDCSVAIDGTSLVRVGVRQGDFQPLGRERHQMLSVRGQHLLRWDFVAGEHQASLSHHAADGRLAWGSHAKAAELAHLDMGRIVEARYAPKFQAILNPIAESYAREIAG